MLASLVIDSLQLQASDIMTESLRAVNFASLVMVAYIVHELYMFYLGATQHGGSIHVVCFRSLFVQSFNSVLDSDRVNCTNGSSGIAIMAF